MATRYATSMIHIELDHILSSDDAVTKIRDIVNGVAANHEPYVLTVNGAPSVAIVHIDTLEHPETTPENGQVQSVEPTQKQELPAILPASPSMADELATYAAMNATALKEMQEKMPETVVATNLSESVVSEFAAPSTPAIPPSEAAIQSEDSSSSDLSMSTSSLPPLPESSSPLNDEPSEEELHIGGGLPPLTGMQALQQKAPASLAPAGLPPLTNQPTNPIFSPSRPVLPQEQPSDPTNSSPLAE